MRSIFCLLYILYLINDAARGTVTLCRLRGISVTVPVCSAHISSFFILISYFLFLISYFSHLLIDVLIEPGDVNTVHEGVMSKDR